MGQLVGGSLDGLTIDYKKDQYMFVIGKEAWLKEEKRKGAVAFFVLESLKKKREKNAIK